MYPLTQNKNNLFALLIVLAALTAPSMDRAYALESDRFKPIDVAADSAVLDDKAGRATYRGNVILTQGTLKIQADKLTIEAGNEGKVEKVIASGDLAYFEQIPNPDDKPVKAQANTVEYYVANEKIVLIENARVVQNENLFEGNVIEYDIRAQKLQARGKTLTAEDSTGEETPGRVKMVLQPQTEGDVATPAPDTSPDGSITSDTKPDVKPETPTEPAEKTTPPIPQESTNQPNE